MIQKIAFLLAYIVILAAGIIMLERSIQKRIDNALQIRAIHALPAPASERSA